MLRKFESSIASYYLVTACYSTITLLLHVTVLHPTTLLLHDTVLHPTTVQPRLSEHLMSQAHPDGRNIRITITLHGIAWTLNAHARVGISYEYH